MNVIDLKDKNIVTQTQISHKDVIKMTTLYDPHVINRNDKKTNQM
jgi:hypothetical protein